MGPPLRKLVMKLLFFQIFALTAEAVFNLTPEEDQVAPVLKVAHFDCNEMTENILYPINQVRPCHITPEEFEISKAKIVLYTKHFRKELNATKCRVQHQPEKWHCGHHDQSRIECDGKGWITRDTFLPHMQTTTLKVTLETREVLSDTGLILPCALEELGCETTSLDPYAYIWEYPDNCAISILRTEECQYGETRKEVLCYQWSRLQL